MKEDKFIEIIKQSLPNSANYIGDDTAFIKNRDLILTQDTMIEDIHFRISTTTPYELGTKAVAINLSDIAASGGIPKYLLISLSLPSNIDESFIKDFYQGVNDITTRYNVLTVGGDITGAEKINISITAIGAAEGINPATRRSAKPGDIVITTGVYGSSAAGFWLMENEEKFKKELSEYPEFLIEKFKKSHKTPLPQTGFGRIIANLSQPDPTMMDTSDGLADALLKISKMSNVSIEVDLNKIPYDPNLKDIANIAKIDINDWIFFGGEDYEIIATVTEDTHNKLAESNIPVRKIGIVKESSDTAKTSKVLIKNDDQIITITQETMDNKAFDHFKEIK